VGWRVEVVHTTGYRYDSPVPESYNEARLTPASGGHQEVLASRLETVPPARPLRYADYWGSEVAAFELHAPHTELVVTATSLVQTGGALAPVRAATWDHLATDVVRDRFAEFLEPSALLGRDRALTRAARALGRTADPVDAVLAACRWVREKLAYRAGATEVRTTAVEAWEARAGVCQDFAHLALLLVREMGVPARYVAGYLLPRADTAVGETVPGQSHAWVEAWTGGWWAHDPTNDIPVGHRHVRVAVGRDYADVPPLKGVYAGGAAAAMDVRVEMTRRA
jgi:transglutaminase-like putative cysteine protease